MFFYSILLLTHIFGSFILFIMMFTALLAVKRGFREHYGTLAVKIGLGSAWQLISGSILTLFAPEKPQLFYFCSRIGIYLTLILAVELLLFYKMRSAAQIFPFHQVVSSITLGAVFVVLVIQTLV